MAVWGDNVRYWRTERGMSQAGLARRLKGQANQSALSEIEAGRRRPTDQQRIAIARALDVSYTHLFPFPKDVR